ncbi:hypothetical protein J8C02_13480 [Chloracidobacterium sp. MS 40/45]|uniref:hypothetical protein n=1 Tax=Chloracidobacterium aggregatum TaxID=2851959 RepID=UPI001B8D63DA|nr:hypothetical protein [Chloracidobacterium aggregatum]QUW01155.1 hypothetical protein J8C02_13480 [Chloracidobacterium sp. MS 40/45]
MLFPKDRPTDPSVGEISFDDMAVSYTPPDGAARRLAWADLQAVEIITTSGGPFAGDVFRVLLSDGPPLFIPQAADRPGVLLKRLQELPGFDNHALPSRWVQPMTRVSCAGSGLDAISLLVFLIQLCGESTSEPQLKLM